MSATEAGKSHAGAATPEAARESNTKAQADKPATASLSMYSGGCHCGKVRYEVSLDLGPVVSCNCSICTMRGSLLAFVSADQFTLLQGADALRDYQFNNHIIHHLFCTACGTESFARGTPPGGKTEMVAINVRCLDGIDLGGLTITEFNGRAL